MNPGRNTDDFSVYILKDLVEEGYESEALLEEFIRRQENTKEALKRLTEEARFSKAYGSLDEMLRDED